MLCVVYCLFWLFMCRYLLKAEATLDNQISHVDSKSTDLGPKRKRFSALVSDQRRSSVPPRGHLAQRCEHRGTA